VPPPTICQNVLCKEENSSVTTRSQTIRLANSFISSPIGEAAKLPARLGLPKTHTQPRRDLEPKEWLLRIAAVAGVPPADVHARKGLVCRCHVKSLGQRRQGFCLQHVTGGGIY
jgi:hypothetical protein